ncbi:MAG TPA: substrate-binding domain-containing protein [Bryobacteraceae bacterium]|nr:substrate-binding domain-containing protein [Bryobacteraceae bacterium]
MRTVTIAALTSALWLAGCGGGRHEATEAYFLVTSNVKIAYWQEAAAGMAAAARQLGVKSEMVGPESYDPQGEREAFEQVVARQPAPAGIMVSAANPDVLRPAIDAAIAKGIPVITVDADVPDSKRLLFVGTDNYEAGQLGAELLVKRLGGKGNVVFYTIVGQGNLVERMEGYKRVLIQHPGIRIVQTVDMKGDPVVAFETTKKILETVKPVPDAFVCLEALSCQEVADVLDRQKVTGKTLIAMDTNRSTLEWIQKGMIYATIAQKPYTMAYYGVKVLDDLYHNKPERLDQNWARDTRSPLPVFIDTGTTLIDASNVEAYLKQP